jgi:hypothetical protein
MLTLQWDVSITDIITHGNSVGIDIELTNFVATYNGLLIKKTMFFALRRTQAKIAATARYINSGSIGINITHSQDTAVPIGVNLSS